MVLSVNVKCSCVLCGNVTRFECVFTGGVCNAGHWRERLEVLFGEMAGVRLSVYDHVLFLSISFAIIVTRGAQQLSHACCSV